MPLRSEADSGGTGRARVVPGGIGRYWAVLGGAGQGRIRLSHPSAASEPSEPSNLSDPEPSGAKARRILLTLS